MSTVPQELKIRFVLRGLTLAVAESASAGHLAALLASVSGSSLYFEGGVVAYSLGQKVRHLGVDREHAASVNCVSERVACEMAEGVRRAFGTNVGLSITGYAEPDLAAGIENPFCWVGFAIEDRVWAERVEYEVDPVVHAPPERRVDAQVHFAWMAIEGLLNYLRSLG